jgi:hypothetical protein
MRLLRLLAQALATTIVATGLLYLLRAAPPATVIPVHDAVPLDELPGHDTTSLLLLALVWPCAAAAVLLLTSRKQLPAPFAFALATLGCSLLSCAISLEIVRQTTTAQALAAAAAVPAVYIEALLAALSAILIRRLIATDAHQRPPTGRTTTSGQVRGW